jgi:hypothetical protein
VATRAVAAQDLTIDWSRTVLTAGVVLPGQGPGGTAALELRAAATGPTSLHVVTIDHPPIARPRYAVSGEVRYQGVEEQGYLEMWTVFPDGQRFFSRTLGARGPQAALHDDSNWRPFELPFDMSGASQAPSRLEINLVLPGRGTVWLGPMQLRRAVAQAEAAQGAWWSARSGTLFGAMLGSLVGVVGATIGVLGGRGKARRLVVGLLVGLITVGACLALVGVAAALSAQPRHVWYPLLVIGGASGLIGLVILPPMRRRFAADELRRIDALDARARS